MKKDYTVLGVSSGLGVSLYPFKENLMGNVELRGIFHTKHNEQWKANFGDIPLIKNPQDLKNTFKDPDIMISSPDCGSGSVLRYSRSKKLGDHNKNDSLKLFFDALLIFKPKLFLFENLKNLFVSFPRSKFKEFTQGYRLIEHCSPVSNFGNSQVNRKRLIIVGIRNDISPKVDKYFKLPHYEDRILTCQQLYGDLRGSDPDFGHVREDIDEVISIHARKRMTLKSIRDKWNTEFKDKRRWDVEPGFNFTTAPGVYRNLKEDFPATARKANRQFDDRGLTLTPRQLARIQGVPDDFVIHIEMRESKYWINKARTIITKSPPMEISVWFKDKLEKVIQKGLIPDFSN